MEGAPCPLWVHAVSSVCAGTSEDGVCWVNRTFCGHFQYYCHACVPFQGCSAFNLERGAAVSLWLTWGALHVFQCSVSAGLTVLLVSISQTRFSLCDHTVTHSQAADCSQPAALCGFSVHLLTAGCPQAWGVAKHPWAFLKTQLRSNCSLLCGGELDTKHFWRLVFPFLILA